VADECEQWLRIVSRQLDRATTERETQVARAHTLKCEKCRLRFNVITGTDNLMGRALRAQGLSDGVTSLVAEKLAQAYLTEAAGGRPRLLLGVAASLGVLVVVLLALSFSRSGPEVAAIGHVARLEGVAELAAFKSASFRSARLGEKLPQGSKLRTGTGSALLKLSGGRDIAVGMDTLVDLARYHDGEKVLLGKGELYIPAADGGIQVDTPGAKVYAAKSSFLVRYEDSGKTTLVVESGEASLFNMAGAATAAAGEKSEAQEGEAPRPPSRVNLKNFLGWVRQFGL
jgi:hypothetical protein